MPELRTKTAVYGSVTIVVREKIGSDVFDEMALLRALPTEGKRASVRRDNFVACANRTLDINGLSFAWITPDSSDADVVAAYEQWKRCEPGLLIVWANTLYDANKAADPELAPAAPGEASALP